MAVSTVALQQEGFGFKSIIWQRVTVWNSQLPGFSPGTLASPHSPKNIQLVGLG